MSWFRPSRTAPEVTSDSGSVANWGVVATAKVSILLFLLVVVVVGPLVHPYADQQASRYALTGAIWDDHTIQLDDYTHVLGRDAAIRDGRYYSDKAPLQPLMAVPLYAMYRTVGGEPATVLRTDENLGLWWQTLWLAAVPLGLIAALMYLLAYRINPATALPAAAAIAFGTILLPFGAVLFGHVLAGLFVLGAVVLVSTDDLNRSKLIGAGACLGAAVAVEYTAGLAVLVISGFVLWRQWRSYHWLVLGGLPFVVLLGAYHAVAFGSPLSHPYTYNIYWGVVEEQKGFFHEFAGLSFDHLVSVLVSGRGFLVASPIVVLSLVGLLLLVRRRDAAGRRAGMLAIIMFGAFLLLPLTWHNPWGGWSPGPRYIVPALPVLVLGAGAAWSLRPVVTRYAVGVSVLTMVLATITNPLVERDGQGGLGTWLGRAVNGELADTVFTMGAGGWGWLLHGLLVSLIAYFLFRAWQDQQQGAAL